MMPEMDGFALVDRIQRAREPVGPTLMMLSSANRREDAARCRDLGVASYLTKPVRQLTLFDAILTALESATGLDQPASPGPADHAAVGQADARPLRLLLAEDNAVNQRLAVSLLERRGHSVVVAGNGREALAALDDGPYDAVLMDVQMPELDGLEATAAIRAREREEGAGEHLPIIAMTAHAMKGDRERCLAAGMDAYVSKPLRPGELYDVLDRIATAGGAGRDGAADTAPELARFDMDAALDRVDGDAGLMRELVELFLEECRRADAGHPPGDRRSRRAGARAGRALLQGIRG